MLSDIKSERSHENLSRVAAKLKAIQSEGLPTPTHALCDSIRNLVIIASSSRGGSSVFAEMLRRCDTFLHFRAEINPVLYVHGLTYPASGTGSDRLSAEQLTLKLRTALDRDLRFECGNPKVGELSPAEIDRYSYSVAWRLCIQWPELDVSYAGTRRLVESTFEQLKRSCGWTKNEVRSPQIFWCVFLEFLRRDFPSINPYYYDLDPSLVARHFPNLPVPEGAPSRFLIEEPPFIVPVPLKEPTAREIEAKPLVVKTPSNVYRLDFLTSLFPNATPWILHLTRSAGPSINGLYDGWCHRGFFSHYMPGKLRIPGYSDRFPEWGADWWNFDLPPGWEEYSTKPLTEVCAFQWYAAHNATRAYLKKNPGTRYLRVRSEDVLCSNEETRRKTIESLVQWLHLRSGEALAQALLSPIDPVMATAPPKPNRWLEKENIIRPVLSKESIGEMIRELGY